MTIPTLAKPTPQQRKRINSNPKVSLAVYRRMKADDTYGFGVTVIELATRIMTLKLSGTLNTYLSNHTH